MTVADTIASDFPYAAVTAELRVRSGTLDSVGHRHTLDKAEVVIGRSGRSDVPIEDMSVSERHAMVVTRQACHLIYDLGSSNGTYVNDERVLQAELRNGDFVRCGDTIFEYVTAAGVALEGADGVIDVGPDAASLTPVEPHRVPPYAEPTTAEIVGDQPRAIAVRTTPLAQHVPNFDAFGHAQYAQTRRLDEEDEEISAKELIDRLRRIVLFFGPYWRSILAMTVAGLLIGCLSFFAVPPARTAIFEISLVPKTIENPVERFERSNVQFFRSAQQNFRSPTLIRKSLETQGFKNPDAAFLSSLQGRLQFVNLYANTYVGSFSDGDEQLALTFLQTHLTTYLDTEIEKTLKVIRAEADFLKAQLEDTEKDLKRTEGELLVFKEQNIDGLPEQARQYYDYLFELKRREREVDREIGRLSSMVHSDRTKLRTEEPLVDSRVLTTRPFQEAIVDVKRQIAVQRAKGMGEDHPEIKRLRVQLQELQELASNRDAGGQTELEQRRNPAYTSLQESMRRLEVSAKSARSDRVRIADDIKKIRDIVDKLPKLEAEYAALTRSYDDTKSLHSRLFKQLKTTELQLQLEKASATARYDIISPPTIAFQSTTKAIAKRGIIFGLAGFLLGLLLAALRQLKTILAPEPKPKKPMTTSLTRPRSSLQQ